ncbi:MAG: class I tRNA ligase family protein, partial [Candidatus Aenigmarchaeota archaeon]|nr:class I tRNA ligase family protein [Candidatus Aenigmarchaeota archaeon]
NELVSKISNLSYRVTSFIEKNFDGKIPKSKKEKMDVGEKEIQKYLNLMSQHKLNEALMVAVNFADEINKYFQEEKPWETVKSDVERCKRTLKTSVELTKNLWLMLYPFIPQSAEKALKLIGVKKIRHTSFKKRLSGKVKAEMIFKFLNK